MVCGLYIVFLFLVLFFRLLASELKGYYICVTHYHRFLWLLFHTTISSDINFGRTLIYYLSAVKLIKYHLKAKKVNCIIIGVLLERLLKFQFVLKKVKTFLLKLRSSVKKLQKIALHRAPEVKLLWHCNTWVHNLAKVLICPKIGFCFLKSKSYTVAQIGSMKNSHLWNRSVWSMCLPEIMLQKLLKVKNVASLEKLYTEAVI